MPASVETPRRLALSATCIDLRVSFIERRQQDVIKRILRHCGLWDPQHQRSSKIAVENRDPLRKVRDKEVKKAWTSHTNGLHSGRDGSTFLSVINISESSRPRQQWFRQLTVGLSYEQAAWQAEVQDLS